MGEPTGQQRISSICSECGAPVDFELGAQQVRCGHCGAGLAVDHGERLLRLSCPGCGGNFYSLDGSMSGHCPFCRASLLALTRGRVLQFVIPPAIRPPPQASGATLLLLPFWLMKGLMLGWDVGAKITVDESGPAEPPSSERFEAYTPPVTMRKESGPLKLFRGRVVDLSFPDPVSRAVGATGLRWRAALFPMEPLSERHEQLGRLVRPALEVERAREELVGRAYRIGGVVEGITRLDCQRQDLVTEELSLVYYPFWSSATPAGAPVLTDGVTGEPEPAYRPEGAQDAMAPALGVLDDLRVIELRCGVCGEGLVAGNRSVVLPCAGCGSFWLVTRDGLKQFGASYAAPRASAGGDGGTRLWLPFWRVPVEVGFCGRKAATVADLIARLGVTRPASAVESEPLDAPLCYYAPAYGALRAPRVDHAARDMTRAQPRLEPGETGKGELFTCFFGPDDARRMAYVTWIQVLPSAVAHQLRSLRLAPGEPALWYLPFEEREREIVNLVTGARYERALFRGLRH